MLQILTPLCEFLICLYRLQLLGEASAESFREEDDEGPRDAFLTAEAEVRELRDTYTTSYPGVSQLDSFGAPSG